LNSVRLSPSRVLNSDFFSSFPWVARQSDCGEFELSQRKTRVAQAFEV
jgi:hypothetical protein